MADNIIDNVYKQITAQCREGDRAVPKGDNRALPTIPRDPADVLRRVEAADEGSGLLWLFPPLAVVDTAMNMDPLGRQAAAVAQRVLKKIDTSNQAFGAVDANLRPIAQKFAFPDPDGQNPDAAKAVWKKDQRPSEITSLPDTQQLIHALKSKLDDLADNSLTQVYASGKVKDDQYVQQIWTGGRQNTAKSLQNSPVGVLCSALTGCKSTGGSTQPLGGLLGGGKDKPADTATGTSARDAINTLWKALTDKSDKARQVLVDGGDPLRDKVLTEEVTSAAKSVLVSANASLTTAVSKAKSWNLALESGEVSEVVTPVKNTPKPTAPATPKPSTPGTPTPTPTTPKPSEDNKGNKPDDNKGTKPLTTDDIKRMMEQQTPKTNTPTGTTPGGGIQTPNLGGGSGGGGPQAAKPASTNPSEGQGPKKVEPKDTSDDEAKKRAEEAEKKRKEDEAKRKEEEEERKRKEQEEKDKKNDPRKNGDDSKEGEEKNNKEGKPPAGNVPRENGGDKPAPGAGQPPQQGQPGVPAAPQDSKPPNTAHIGNKDVTYPSGKSAALGELLSRGTPEHPASFSNAAAQSGINLPPAGELVGQPVSPQQAQVGDAAVDKDGKMYQVIGDGKVVGEDGKTHDFKDLKFGETGTGFFKLDGTAGDAPQGAVPPQGDAGQTPKDGPAQQGGQPGAPGGAPGGAPAPGAPGVPNAPADGAGAGGQGGQGGQPGAPAGGGAPGAGAQPGAGIPQPSNSPTPDDGTKPAPGNKPDGASTPGSGASTVGGASTSGGTGDPSLPSQGAPNEGSRPPTALGSGVQHDQTVLNPKAVPSGN